MSPYALLHLGALRAVFPLPYTIVCLQFDGLEVLFRAGVGIGQR